MTLSFRWTGSCAWRTSRRPLAGPLSVGSKLRARRSGRGYTIDVERRLGRPRGAHAPGPRQPTGEPYGEGSGLSALTLLLNFSLTLPKHTIHYVQLLG